ncbi:MAG: hypothetical protein JXR97_14190 [Planctomycetes bacterium]|nr:hypothetical protein [Planctomycetota bacterium]
MLLRIQTLLASIYGDTRIGNSFDYMPRWLFVVGGVLLQLPMVFAFWFNDYIHR